MERPSSVPRPTPFVEKKGSTARASVASSMPVPLSTTASLAKRPCLGSVAGRRSVTPASMRRCLLWGIASRAFTARFRIAISN